MDMAEAGIVSIKEDKEDWVDFSEEQDVSGEHVHEVYVKMKDEDCLDNIDSDGASFGQTHQIFTKTDEGDPLNGCDGEALLDGRLEEAKEEEIEVKLEPIVMESDEAAEQESCVDGKSYGGMSKVGSRWNSTPDELLASLRDLEEDRSGSEQEIVGLGEDSFESDHSDLSGPEECRSESESDCSNDSITYPPEGSGPWETAPDGTEWLEISGGQPHSGRRTEQTLLRSAPGPTAHAKRNIREASTLSAFHLLVNDSLLDNIVKCTVDHGKLEDPNWFLSKVELLRFIALLYAKGLLGQRNLKSCWDKTWGSKIFSSTMPRDRFLNILKHLRFDKRLTRSQVLRENKFALASEPWNEFFANSRACYNPGKSVTAGEQLYPLKCRCPFAQFMANRTDKFGIKYWVLTDAKSKYCLNAFPHCSKDDERNSNKSLGEFVVLRLTEPYKNSGVNVTCSSYFSSVILAEKLKKDKISLVGEISKDGQELPPSVKKRNEIHSTKVFKNSLGHILVNYQARKDKSLLLLTTMHQNILINDTQKKKPDTVLFFNANRFGVDVMDSMCRKYSTRTASRRWPVHVFFNILDLASINSWVLFREVTGSRISRKSFIQRLVTEMVGNLFASPSCSIVMSSGGPARAQKRRRCQVSADCENKSCNLCSGCGRIYCGRCAQKVMLCRVCAEN